MSSHLRSISKSRILSYRPRVHSRTERLESPLYKPLVARFSSKTDLPKSPDGKGPNSDTLPSISEEASQYQKAKGDKGPELEQGTPVEEVLKRDDDALQNAPKAIKDKIDAKNIGKRSFSTMAARRQDLVMSSDSGPSDILASTIPLSTMATPLAPLKPDQTLVGRYPAILEEFCGLIMRHGKKAVAQKNIAAVLSQLRTSPAPNLNHDKPLIPGHPPSSYLPLNPVLYLTLAIDSLAPMVRIVQLKGQAGGGASLPVPVALTVRQRRRTAFMWIIDAVSKKSHRISGHGTFAYRLGQEIIAVVEGKSKLWERRANLHKQAVSARSNVSSKKKRVVRSVK